MNKQLARMILNAMKPREDSYVEDSIDNAITRNGVINFDKLYRIDIRQAVELTCPPEMIEPVYLLLRYAWWDLTSVWANEQLKNDHSDTININGYNVPKPISDNFMSYELLWVVNAVVPDKPNMIGANIGDLKPYIGLIHSSKEAVIIHGKALRSFTAIP